MAKRKRHRRSTTSVSRTHTKRHPKRRRRMSAGSKDIFKNPIVGAILGGIASNLIVKNVALALNKALPPKPGEDFSMNETIAMLSPAIIGFLIKKKAPAISTGLIAMSAVKFLASKVNFLAEDGNTSFVSERILADSNRYLSARNEFLSDSDFRYNISEASSYGYNM